MNPLPLRMRLRMSIFPVKSRGLVPVLFSVGASGFLSGCSWMLPITSAACMVGFCPFPALVFGYMNLNFPLIPYQIIHKMVPLHFGFYLLKEVLHLPCGWVELGIWGTSLFQQLHHPDFSFHKYQSVPYVVTSNAYEPLLSYNDLLSLVLKCYDCFLIFLASYISSLYHLCYSMHLLFYNCKVFVIFFDILFSCMCCDLYYENCSLLIHQFITPQVQYYVYFIHFYLGESNSHVYKFLLPVCPQQHCHFHFKNNIQVLITQPLIHHYTKSQVSLVAPLYLHMLHVNTSVIESSLNPPNICIYGTCSQSPIITTFQY